MDDIAQEKGFIEGEWNCPYGDAHYTHVLESLHQARSI